VLFYLITRARFIHPSYWPETKPALRGIESNPPAPQEMSSRIDMRRILRRICER
jgi:hypothetical protein